MKRTLAITAIVVAVAGAFSLGVWTQYTHDQPLIQQGKQARVKAEAERTRLAEARERTLAAQRRAKSETAEAKRRQAQLVESLNGWQEAFNESAAGGSDSGTASNDFVPPTETLGGNPTALCRDGTHSYSASRRGTCSHHGGVLIWYR